MGGGNGCKAAMRRERSKDQGKKTQASQLKVNEKALSYVCQSCFTSFLCTANEKILADHAQDKHKKSLLDCFPNFKK